MKIFIQIGIFLKDQEIAFLAATYARRWICLQYAKVELQEQSLYFEYLGNGIRTCHYPEQIPPQDHIDPVDPPQNVSPTGMNEPC